jgi:hypothetical protein
MTGNQLTQMPQVHQVLPMPQLPPAQIQKTEPEINKTATLKTVSNTSEPQNSIQEPIQETSQTQQPVEQPEVQTVPCPICKNDIKVYSSTCSHCGTSLN